MTSLTQSPWRQRGMVDKSEGKGVCITNQPHLMLTLFFSEFTKEEKEREEKRKGVRGGVGGG